MFRTSTEATTSNNDEAIRMFGRFAVRLIRRIRGNQIPVCAARVESTRWVGDREIQRETPYKRSAIIHSCFQSSPPLPPPRNTGAEHNRLTIQPELGMRRDTSLHRLASFVIISETNISRMTLSSMPVDVVSLHTTEYNAFIYT